MKKQRRAKGRVNGGRLQAWTAALAHLRRNRGLVLQATAAVAGATVVINLPFVPGAPYVRGFATAMVIVGFLWLMSWFAWVSSGLAFRIQGSLAEDAVTESLRESRHTYDIVASLKFGQNDVDQVLVTPTGVSAVETRWHVRRPDESRLAADAHHAASGARSVRNTLATMKNTNAFVDHVSAALVICGPGSANLKSRRVMTGLGPVDVINYRDLGSWMERRGQGSLDEMLAKALGERLHQLARDRDRAAATAGPLLRYLARVRY